ncbi:hypothetical protein Tco_0625838 [Tanacetum coccineum]|uniref:Uncharacterized protein n=1 Tax=Tanacetum coccineum TaxID=301880 RepID=A0ABQ4WHZ0_9ASTR
MDLYGAMRVASNHRKRYVPGESDDYNNRYNTWFNLLRSKDEVTRSDNNFPKKNHCPPAIPVIINKKKKKQKKKKQQQPIRSLSKKESKHVTWTLFYPKYDRRDIRKLSAKGDIGFSLVILQILVLAESIIVRQRKSWTSGLDLTYAPSTITTQKSTEPKLDLLFEAMYDDNIDSALTPAHSSSQSQNIPITSNDVDEFSFHQHVQQQDNQAPFQSNTVADNVLNVMFEGNTFVNPFSSPSTSSAESSSPNVDPSNLKTDGDMCIDSLSMSTIEPSNVKEAMTDSGWIDSMQEELL